MPKDVVSTVSKSKRHFLKEKDAKKLLFDFSQRFKVDAERLFGSKPSVEGHDAENTEIFVINGKPALAKAGGALFPTLLFDKVFPFLPKIVVDMGAVSHVCGGADVMAPGVVRIEGDFDENDLLLIVDERHGRPLAIGTALLNSQVVKKTKHGKIAKNVHYVGDKLWASLKRV